jgi:hypothetical protein
MVVGNDMMYFTLIENGYVVDCIPLAEIVQVKKMGEEGNNEAHSTRPHNLTISGTFNHELSSEIFHRALRIDTNPEGYNSGRTYYVQISSDHEFSRLAISLAAHIKVATKRLETRTVLERSRKKVRKVFHSSIFQCTASFFILAVSLHHFRHAWLVKQK